MSMGQTASGGGTKQGAAQAEPPCAIPPTQHILSQRSCAAGRHLPPNDCPLRPTELPPGIAMNPDPPTEGIEALLFNLMPVFPARRGLEANYALWQN